MLHAPALSVVERIGLWLCLACAASVHLTHPVLALLVLGIGLVAGRFSRTPFAMGPRALLILAAVAFAVAGILLHNRLLTGRITYSPTSSLVVLARSIEDGPAREYLQASCPASGYRLCQSINDLNTKSDQLLWSGRGPFQDLYKGGMNPAEDEARNILSGTVRTRPREFVDKFRANAWQELLSVRTTAMDISSSGHPFVSEMIRRHLPSDYPSYASSRQLTGRLHALLDPIGRFHAALALAAYPVLIGVIVFLLYMRRVLEASVFLCLGGGVLGNALMTGPLAEPLDRYQSRVAWLLTLALIVFVCRRAEHVRDQVDGAVRARA
jgi:hypothetical protein